MKRASYKEGIEYIALNDAPGEEHALQAEMLIGYLTVQLLAALFEVPPLKVAMDVIEYRMKERMMIP